MNEKIEKKFDEQFYVEFSNGEKISIEHSGEIKHFIDTHFVSKCDLEEKIDEYFKGLVFVGNPKETRDRIKKNLL